MTWVGYHYEGIKYEGREENIIEYAPWTKGSISFNFSKRWIREIRIELFYMLNEQTGSEKLCNLSKWYS